MKGKIFTESSNVFQDQAKILFNYYQSVADWIDENDSRDFYEWISPEQRALALKTDSVWTLQWYPATPIGFVSCAAAELEPLLAFAREHKP